MPRAVLDRIEGEVAVIVADDREWPLPAFWLPEGAREGDVLEISLTRDDAATLEATERTAAHRSRLGQDDDGGDFSL